MPIRSNRDDKLTGGKLLRRRSSGGRDSTSVSSESIVDDSSSALTESTSPARRSAAIAMLLEEERKIMKGDGDSSRKSIVRRDSLSENKSSPRKKEKRSARDTGSLGSPGSAEKRQRTMRIGNLLSGIKSTELIASKSGKGKSKKSEDGTKDPKNKRKRSGFRASPKTLKAIRSPLDDDLEESEDAHARRRVTVDMGLPKVRFYEL